MNIVRFSIVGMASLVTLSVLTTAPSNAQTVVYDNGINLTDLNDAYQSDPNLTTFINNTLVKQIKKSELHWSNAHVDPLTNKFANIAATWNEDMTDFADNKTSQTGYFTAVAEKTVQGWQLRNATW